MHPIKVIFEQRFANWEITLPERDLEQSLPGSIRKGGWTINYRFDTSEGEEYIEYYASHRMTNDTLNRIYADGKYEMVDSCQEFLLANNPEAEQAYIDHNRQFYTKVKALGLF